MIQVTVSGLRGAVCATSIGAHVMPAVPSERGAFSDERFGDIDQNLEWPLIEVGSVGLASVMFKSADGTIMGQSGPFMTQ